LTFNILHIEIPDARIRRLLLLEKTDFPSSSLEMPYDSKPNAVNEEART
jgi:hypothetical protein